MTIDLSSMFASEWRYINGTEAVTLYRKTGDGVYDNGTAVGNAFSPGFTKDLAGQKAVNRNNFLLWQSQTGNPAPKIGDVIQDSGGTQWVIWRVEIQAYGARFSCEVKQDR